MAQCSGSMQTLIFDMFMFSRCHIVAQFNSGTYDFIIAADEKYLVDPNPQHKHKKKKKKA